MLVPGPDVALVEIDQLEPEGAQEVMGLWQTPTGSINAQLATLSEKVNKRSNLFKNSYLHKKVVWKAFWGTMWRTIRAVPG